MPSYKTHSIHGELIFPQIEKRTDVNMEDMKTFSMGPDTMISTDYETFDYQHVNNTKTYFETMLKLIKANHLQDNAEVIAFLYGQLDHYILDIVTHPLIYYMTDRIKTTCKIPQHALIEHWIDDYVCQKNGKNELFYYHKWKFNKIEIKKLINRLYKRVYKVKNESKKYSNGIVVMNIYDIFVRNVLAPISRLVDKTINMGDITYRKDLSRILPYLNLTHDIWFNPETGEEYKESFDDLWDKSMEVSCDTIIDVNRYLYGDGVLNNRFINNNVSFNTGLPCEKGQTLKYIKKY